MNFGPTQQNIIERVKRLLLKPNEEWRAIDAEPMTVAGIYKGWVLPLAAIPAVALLVGTILFSSIFTRFFRLPTMVMYALSTAIIQYVLSIVAVFILALVIDALAPNFGSSKNQVQATKVAAFSMTAAWIAGVALILPPLGVLAMLGALYGFYLLFVGLPILMRTPQNQAVTYVIVTVVAYIVVMAAIKVATFISGLIFLPRTY